MDSNSEIQGYNVYPMLHFHRKFSSGITSPSTHLILLALATLSIVYSSAQVPTEVYLPGVTGKFPATLLISKAFAYPTGIPQKVDTDIGLFRGSWFGFN